MTTQPEPEQIAPSPAAIATAKFVLDEWTDADLIGLSMAATAGVVVEGTPVFGKARDAAFLDLGPEGWRLRDSTVQALGYVMKKRFVREAEPPAEGA